MKKICILAVFLLMISLILAVYADCKPERIGEKELPKIVKKAREIAKGGEHYQHKWEDYFTLEQVGPGHKTIWIRYHQNVDAVQVRVKKLVWDSLAPRWTDVLVECEYKTWESKRIYHRYTSLAKDARNEDLTEVLKYPAYRDFWINYTSSEPPTWIEGGFTGVIISEPEALQFFEVTLKEVNNSKFKGGIAMLGVGQTFSLAVLFLWIIPIILCIVICSSKGRSGLLGFVLGLFLGWIGVIICACLTNFRALRTNVNVQVGSNINPPPVNTSPPPATDVASQPKEKSELEILDEQIAILEKKKKLRQLQEEEEKSKAK